MIGVIVRDEVCSIKMARLRGADMAAFRDRMKTDVSAPSTIVRRLNPIQTAIGQPAVHRLDEGAKSVGA